MSLFTNWTTTAEEERTDAASKSFWTNYYEIEKDAYAKILGAKRKELKGKVCDLAKELGYEDEVLFAGFIDGINTSLSEPFTEEDIKKIESDSEIDRSIDFEKLYYNMLDAKAHWLYELPEWEDNLSTEKRKEITKEFRVAGIVVNENKVGRNDPCTCGSGKKYKKCCGK